MADFTFSSRVPEVLDAVEAATARTLEIIGGKAETYAKARCPVGTPESTGIPGYIGGTLRNSITHQQYDKDTEIIGSNVYYAPLVELGTIYMNARPYLRPAAENHPDEYRSIWEQALRRG